MTCRLRRYLGPLILMAVFLLSPLAPHAADDQVPQQRPQAAPAQPAAQTDGLQGPQTAPFRPARPIAITGGLLIDATGAPPRWDQTVVIEGERISAVGPMDSVKIPEGAEVIDATGM